jgi:aldehyde dehydrogenase (NAD+)
MYVFTDDQKKVDRIVNETSSGALTVNDLIKHFAIPTLPFGVCSFCKFTSQHR